MKDDLNWATVLNDRRSKKVVFLSHCLLNENTRYMGGASHGGVIPEIVQWCLDNNLGVIQMPCPEQLAWGGVNKRRLLWFFGSQGSLRYRLRNTLLPLLLWYTRRVYRKIAIDVAHQIADYSSSGYTVAGIIGVDGSPSCGVWTTLDMKHSLEQIGRLTPSSRTEDMNALIQRASVTGSGIYIEALRKEIARLGLDVPLLAHDLFAELRGESVHIKV